MDPRQDNHPETEELTVAETAAPEENLPAEELAADTPEEKEEPRTDFQKRVASWSEKKWKLMQAIFGALLGFAVIFFLYGGNDDEGFSMFTIYAVVLALFVPRTLESTCGRSVRYGQKIMLIAMTLGILGQVAKVLLKG